MAAASAFPFAEVAMESTVRCRRRPRRRPCPGFLRLVRHAYEEAIEWSCPSCGDGGVVRGWRGLLGDLSEAHLPEKEAREAGPPLCLYLTEEQHAAMMRLPGLDPIAWRLVMGAIRTEEGIALAGTAPELLRLALPLAVALARNRTGRHREPLLAVHEALTAILG
ncbi:MAG: hypothetical protein D6739_02085 [Nitrospirae bacterium]|nr:MAG: hypothetical protein D6739_02085 [Nitrospirota bacterium]